ncbi:MAG: hypothetical protein KGM17_15785, partial [Sphingomonadales bacterium]|nr:hypothetical protein [Sphingomonadales bacterium]
AAPHAPRRPGRKKRAAAREAANLGHTALVVAPRRRWPAPVSHPATPAVIHLAHLDWTESPVALPLPAQPEPLVVVRAAAPPRARALALPARGLVAAIGDWLASVRRLVLVGLLPRKARAPLPRPPRHLPLRPEASRLATREALETLKSARTPAEG